jgi:hypothetical protein
MYSTVLYWGDGGHWSACLRVVKTRKRDTPAGWTLRSCSLCSMPPYESIESHERGGTDEMDVTRILDPLICPGAWNCGFTLGRVFRLVLYRQLRTGLQLDMQVRRRTGRLRTAACSESDVCYLLPLAPLFERCRYCYCSWYGRYHYCTAGYEPNPASLPPPAH